ncbi:hypothetical protein BU23DRAFT_562817 [Bimuria novae-zelandiae CBS 107.79]|uniref:EthD domain-containing protein n=1 Tax=Bimuria novae-zelandiae CBS 107.79 TaxID=1447943 RepID=A0A6A5W4Q0_9PLEO|nr:hypothetical protein BU23DRAFT_562817 [Bimuria novae-zelandiae CBS 107.79]
MVATTVKVHYHADGRKTPSSNTVVTVLRTTARAGYANRQSSCVLHMRVRLWWAEQSSLISYPHPVWIMLFSLKSARDQVQELNERLGGGKWTVDNHDVVVEFYVRDLAAVEGIINDPDFQKLQSEEAPWIDAERVTIGASLGWVEVYVEQGKVVNILKDEKPAYGELVLSVGV